MTSGRFFGGRRERSNVSVSKKNSRRKKKQILAGEWQMRRTQTNEKLQPPHVLLSFLFFFCCCCLDREEMTLSSHNPLWHTHTRTQIIIIIIIKNRNLIFPFLSFSKWSRRMRGGELGGGAVGCTNKHWPRLTQETHDFFFEIFFF